MKSVNYKLKRRRSQILLKKLSVILLILAFVVLLAGAGLSIYQWHVNRNAAKQAGKLINEANEGIDNGVPSTTPVSDNEFNKYKVAADLPKYVFIPKINVKAIVKPVGTTKDGQLGSPVNIFYAGWYKKSSKPGKTGAMVMDGHVSSWTTKGVFYDLKSLKTGDTIQIQQGNNTKVNYRIVKKTTYNYQNVDMASILSPVNAKLPGLNIITCAGDVIPGTNDFNQRVAVFAEEVK